MMKLTEWWQKILNYSNKRLKNHLKDKLRLLIKSSKGAICSSLTMVMPCFSRHKKLVQMFSMRKGSPDTSPTSKASLDQSTLTTDSVHTDGCALLLTPKNSTLLIKLQEMF
jgi:hypothetical protein